MENKQMECVICLSDININDKYKTICNHIFHSDCIMKWYERGHTCPLCRVSKFSISIEEYETNYWKRVIKMEKEIELTKEFLFKI